jgi:hypothetical protein
LRYIAWYTDPATSITSYSQPAISKCGAFSHNVQRKHAVVFAALKDAAEAAINKSILSRLEPQTNSRQKQWSDHN